MKEETKEALPLDVHIDEVIPYIKDQGKQLNDELAKARKKYGPRYNQKNEFEEMFKRFGRPTIEPEKFAQEYTLILQKKSELPSTIRHAITKICSTAMSRCYFDKLMAEAKEQKKNDTKQGNSETNGEGTIG